jgi:hypothetical protein
MRAEMGDDVLVSGRGAPCLARGRRTGPEAFRKKRATAAAAPCAQKNMRSGGNGVPIDVGDEDLDGGLLEGDVVLRQELVELRQGETGGEMWVGGWVGGGLIEKASE